MVICKYDMPDNSAYRSALERSANVGRNLDAYTLRGEDTVVSKVLMGSACGRRFTQSLTSGLSLVSRVLSFGETSHNFCILLEMLICCCDIPVFVNEA